MSNDVLERLTAAVDEHVTQYPRPDLRVHPRDFYSMVNALSAKVRRRMIADHLAEEFVVMETDKNGDVIVVSDPNVPKETP